MSLGRKAGIIVLTVLLIGMMLTPAVAGGQPARRIVVFKAGVDALAQESIARGAGASEMRALPLINGMSVTLPGRAAEAILARHPGVVRIDDDIVFTKLSTQETPWGIARIQAPGLWSETTGAGVRVAILDTGIQRNHPDLQVAGGYLAIKSGSYKRLPRTQWDDDEGHGTHVAGTVAALNNDYGVVGVAPGASLYAVKALDRNGGGSLSDIIDGIDWCIANGIDVINMSFGASSDNLSLYQAVVRAYNAGVIMVAAAGNSGPGDNTVGYPARYVETIAVAATDSADGIASFSSRGSQVDIAAPGVAVLSTVLGSGYVAWSGTSMATPHVAGVAALLLQANGPMSPAAMKALLKANAEDLGWPVNMQGAGLVRPDLCLAPVLTGTAQGVVTSGGVGLAGALVSVGTTGKTSTTGSDGEYTITGVPRGTHAVTASGTGYVSQTKSVAIGTTATVNFSLEPVPPPSSMTIRLTSDMAEYGVNNWVVLTAVITEGTAPVTGETVRVRATDSAGAVLLDQQLVTGTTGMVSFKFKIGKKMASGTATAVATATKAGYDPATGSMTFVIK